MQICQEFLHVKGGEGIQAAPTCPDSVTSESKKSKQKKTKQKQRIAKVDDPTPGMGETC